MRTNVLIALLVLGLVATGLSTLNVQVASAGLPHVVDGAVGPSAAVGPGNPSNPASAAFYLLNKPAEAIQVEADIQDADGTFFAYYGTAEVGSGWNWAAGDTVVVVVETIRGVNGWTGNNYTTSSDGVLTSGNVDTLPQADIEAIPTLALNKGPTNVNVSWTGLLAANGNVVNYEVLYATTPGGVYNSIGSSSPQVAGGTVWLNHTGRAQGQHCYKIAVNYQRDTLGGLYRTTGTSNLACTTIGAAPTIQTTSPADGATGVAVTDAVIVTFSEAMDTASVTWTIAPVIALTPAWDVTQTTLTLTHPATAFTDCTSYTVQMAGRDQGDGFLLVAGPAPNPWTFTTVCVNPFIQTVSPADGATGVNLMANVVVTFSEPMNTGTVTWTPAPVFTLTGAWNPANTILTLSHATAFQAGTQYAITMAGNDVDGNPLVPGPVPNPFDFTTNSPPTVTLASPAGAESWSGNSLHDIAWTMSDDVTAPSSLNVWINYTSQASTVAIAGPIQRTSPATYQWTVPCINANDVVVTVAATDAASGVGADSSAAFEIDCAVPTVTATDPTSGQADVGATDPIVITFSEGMAAAPTQAAITVTPGVGTLAFSWNPGGTVLTITHATNFAASTSYQVQIGTGATDNSDPGNPIAAYSWTFSVPAVGPTAPANLQFVSATANSITIRWTPPTTYTDGSTLAPTDIQGYIIERAASPTGTRTNLTGTSLWPRASGNQYTDSGLAPGTTYYYWVRVVLNDDRMSGDSNPANGATLQQAPDFPWLWILLLIIIIVVVLVAVLAWRRKQKPVAAAPSEEAAPEESSTEAPPMPEEESGGPGGST